MNEPVTFANLGQIFNVAGAIIGIMYTTAVGSRWYWKAMWIFIGLTSLAALLLPHFLPPEIV